jgi:hypothetical protein
VKRGPSTTAIAAAFVTPIIALLAAPLVASAQAFPRKSLSEGHLEHIQDPPAVIVPKRLEVTPQMVSPFGPYTSYQANVDASGNNIVGDAANEPSLCVDPTNPNRMSIGWRQFNSVTSNFRQAGWAFTSNGGTTWTFPGVLQNNVFRSDPVLNADSSGRFYYLSLLENFFDDIWRSIDGGVDWEDLGQATGGDKQWFTIDNTNSPGRGFQYQCWSTAGNNYNGRQFSRSTDGGLTWRDPVGIPQTPIWGTLDVDTNGNVFTSGVNPNTGQIWCIRSSNANNPAVKPTFDRSTPVNLGGQVVSGEVINPAGIVGQINLAVDHSGTGTNNNIYMLASLQRAGAFNGTDVMFVRSTNGGQTFSSPIRINDDPVNPSKWHWFAAMAVAPSGRIDCVWLDTRNAANNTDSQLFYSFSSDAGQTWSPNVPVSSLFNPFLGYPNQNKMGDYITVVSDNSGANVAYTATFNGEEDVYFLHIPAGGCDLTEQNLTDSALTGWTMQDNSGVQGTTWFGSDGRIFSASSSTVANHSTSDTQTATTANSTISNWLLTPPVRLQNGGRLTFYTRSSDVPSHPDRLQVRVSLNGDSADVGATPDSVGDFTTLLLDVNPNYSLNAYPGGWTQFTVTVNGLVQATTGRFAFRYLVDNGGNAAVNPGSIGIDAVQFTCTPAYVIAVSGSPVDGGNLTGAGRYPGGSNVNLIATPNPNFAFSNWTENGVVVSTSSTYTFAAGADRTLVANFVVVPRVTATPLILPNGGTFTRKVKVKMTCSTPGATIYYTIDGSDPTTASAIFPAPRQRKVQKIVITGAGVYTVKAMAVASGFNNSPIATSTYTVR